MRGSDAEEHGERVGEYCDERAGHGADYGRCGAVAVYCLFTCCFLLICQCKVRGGEKTLTNDQVTITGWAERTHPMMATPGSPDAVLKGVHPCQAVKRRMMMWKISSSAARMCPRCARVGDVGVDVDVVAVVVAGIGARWR